MIPGLYAAGACAVNIAQDGKGYASGTQLAEGSYFGRRVGRHAAAKPARAALIHWLLHDVSDQMAGWHPRAPRRRPRLRTSSSRS